MLRFRTLAATLMARFMVAAILPLAVALSVGFLYSRDKLVADAVVRNGQLAEAVAERIEVHLRQPILVLRQAAVLIEKIGAEERLKKIDDVLDTVTRASSSMESIYLVDHTGRVVSMGLPAASREAVEEQRGIDLSGNDFIMKAVREGKPVWSNSYLSVGSGSASLAVALPTREGGALVGNICRSSLSEFTSSDLERGLSVLVIDSQGNVLSHGVNPAEGTFNNLNNLQIVRDALGGRGGTRRFLFDSLEHLGTAVPLTGPGWVVLVSVPVANATGAVTDMAMVFVGGLAVAMVMAMSFAAVQARRIAQHLQIFADQAQAVAAGGCCIRLASPPFAEMDKIAESFENMVDAVLDREEKLNRALERATLLSAAVEHAGDEIIITDERGVIRYVNPSVVRSSGYETRELVGRTPSIFKSDSHTPDFYRELWQALRSGASWRGRLVSRAKDGSEVIHDAAIAPIRDANGRIAGYVAARRDVTKHLEIERRNAANQQLEALGTLAGGIAHDFNNILAAIIGYAELAETRVSDPQVADYLSNILQASLRASDLVKQILTFSRMGGHGEAGPVVPKTLSKEVLKLMRASIPSTIEIHQEFESGAAVIAEPVEIHRVLVNLCTNASLAMKGAGGVLTVRIAEERLNHESSARFGLAPGRYLALSVTDTGSGIPEAVKARIFEPFFTTRKIGEGSGMGLSVVHGIVTKRGGAVAVDSAPGCGAKFTVFFPVATSGETSQACEKARLQGGSEHVLVADDEKMVRDSTCMMLKRLGYRAKAVADGSEALDYLDKHPGGVDLLLTDMSMPVLDGLQLCTRVRQTNKDLPIVIATGFSRDLTWDKVESLGIDLVLDKPLTLEIISRSIRKVLDVRRKAEQECGLAKYAR